MEKLVEASEQEVRIDFKLNCKCRTNVRLTSLISTTSIAFKVQTSTPHKFLVNPPTGLIPPLSCTTFQIILKPQTQPPPSFPRSLSDRFLVKTIPVNDDSPHGSHTQHLNSLFIRSSLTTASTYDLKLKVAYVGVFLLQYAVSGGETATVRSLIKRQRSIVAELSPKETESILCLATQSSDPANMINLLVEYGLKTDKARLKLDDINAELELKPTWPLKVWTDKIYAAAEFNRTDQISQSMVEATKREQLLDSRYTEGRTPLHLAASNGNLSCDTAIEIAKDKGHEEVIEKPGESILLTAARRGELRKLELLLKKRTTNDIDQYRLTSLHAAAIKGNKEVIDLLIEFGTTDMECQDIEGHAPLHLAVQSGNLGIVEVLVNRGANVSVKNKKGATPLYMAKAMGHEEISQFLICKGASI